MYGSLECFKELSAYVHPVYIFKEKICVRNRGTNIKKGYIDTLTF